MHNHQNEVGVYFELFGMSKNIETGEKDWAGVKVAPCKDFSNADKKCKELYDKFLNSDDNKQALLKMCCLDKMFTPSAVRIITKEHYYENYGDDDDDGDDGDDTDDTE